MKNVPKIDLQIMINNYCNIQFIHSTLDKNQHDFLVETSKFFRYPARYPNGYPAGYLESGPNLRNSGLIR